MKLQLTKTLLNEIRLHGEQTFPHECCGFLIGHHDATTKTVTSILRADNEHETWKQRRFLITPQVYVQAEKHAAALKQDILGFYHSHPNHPARPSEYDLKHAWPWYSYIIVSVREGKAAEDASWVMCEDRSQFDEEPIQMR